jgi:hypothetical protein
MPCGSGVDDEVSAIELRTTEVRLTPDTQLRVSSFSYREKEMEPTPIDP